MAKRRRVERATAPLEHVSAAHSTPPRRSERTRRTPMEYWKGESIVWERGEIIGTTAERAARTSKLTMKPESTTHKHIYSATLDIENDQIHLAIFNSIAHVRIPSSARGLHCGADALRHVLNAAGSTSISRSQAVRHIIQQCPDLRDFQAQDVLEGDEDLLNLPDRNFTVDQLAGAVAASGNYALGVLQVRHLHSRVHVFDGRDEQKRVREECEVLWMKNSQSHWEALVPLESELGRQYRRNGVGIQLVEGVGGQNDNDDNEREESEAYDESNGTNLSADSG